METVAKTAQVADGGTKLAEDVVIAVAAEAGVDPMELSPRLYDVIDPEALNALYADTARARETGLTLSFVYGDWRVTITADREVSVSPLEITF